MQLSLCILVILFSSPKLWADSQLHMRGGYIWGEFTGPTKGTVGPTTAFDINYETFWHNRSSLDFRTILGVDVPTSRVDYIYAGAEYRYYLRGNGMYFSRQGDRVAFSSMPKLRYYLGLSLGISQVIVKSFGNVLKVPSSMFEAGVGFGSIYKISGKLGLSGQLDAGYGFGFSDVAVVTLMLRGVLGISYYY